MGKGLSKQKKPGAIPQVKGQLPLFGGKKGSIPTANRYVEKKVDVHGEEKLVIRVDHDQLETSHAAKAAKATLAAAEDNVCGCGSSFLRPSGLATHRRTCGLVRQLEYRGMDADGRSRFEPPQPPLWRLRVRADAQREKKSAK